MAFVSDYDHDVFVSYAHLDNQGDTAWVSTLVRHLGHVTDVHFTVSHRQPKFIAIDQQPNDDVMHLHRFGEASRLRSVSSGL